MTPVRNPMTPPDMAFNVAHKRADKESRIHSDAGRVDGFETTSLVRIVDIMKYLYCM